MTNPNGAVGTNAAYGTRTSVNAFNDFAQLVNGRGVLSGWTVRPKTGMTVEVGGIAGTRDVAIAEDNLGNRTTVNNRSNSPIEVELEAASISANRYDAIVVYVNNPAQAADEDPDAPSVCGIIAVQGGTTGVSEAQIRSAISADGGTGSVAYYSVLATVFIGAGTSTITAANITQKHIAISAEDIADGEITGNMINWTSLIAGAANFSAISGGGSGEVTVTIPTQANTRYLVFLQLGGHTGYWTSLVYRPGAKTTTSFDITVQNNGAGATGSFQILYLVIPQ